MSFWATLRPVAELLQGFFQGLIALAAVGLVLATVAASFGLLPWPTLSIFFGTQAVAQAGIWMQIGVAFLLVVLLIYLPATVRVSRLERSHRSFAVGMDDVAPSLPHRTCQ